MKKELKIIVLQRGWVLIGFVQLKGSYHKITNPYVIRYWGTTNGLGQLALEGPNSSTKLDKITDVDSHQCQVIFTCKADTAKWKGYYK